MTRKTDLDAAARAVGHTFKDKDLLRHALVHSSASAGRGTATYERLEFLGDRVLGLVVAEMIYLRFPAETEGDLARRHAALVRREALTRVAETAGLGQYIVMSRGEEDAGGRTNPAILADVCEALLGALYLDGGLHVAAAFIEAHWPVMMEESLAPPKDAKTALQEWAQSRGLPLPVYETVALQGPDHSPVFTVRVSVQGISPAEASGASKRVAAQAAARTLLEKVT
ncbi:MAG: ribonuclease III [Rhodospirillaceae bacterium]